MINDFNSGFDAELELKKHQSEIHIRVHRKSKRQCLTIIEGLDKLDLPLNLTIDNMLENLAKKLRKVFNCGATVRKDDHTIHLMGEHGLGVKQYLVKCGIVGEEQIIVHGC